MIRFAVIGVGRMGSVHVRNLAAGRVKNTVLAAVCDVDERVCEGLKTRYPKVKVDSDYKTMVAEEKLDGVLIATPHYSHEEIACYTLSHGINTLTEKPMTVTPKAAKHVIETAKTAGVIAGVSYNQRSNAMYMKAKELVSSGAIGEIVRANLIITDWYRSQAYYNQGGWRASYNGEGGGVLINQCSHQLDVLQWIIGMPKSITATMRTVNRSISVENDVTSVLEYEDYNCSFTASTHELKGANRLEIAGTKGRIIVEKYKMTYYIHDKTEIEVNAGTKQGYGAAHTKKYKMSYGFVRLIKDLLYGQQLRSLNAFCSEIDGRGKQLADISEGINSLRLIDGIYLASWLGERVPVPFDDELYENQLNIQKKKELEKNV